ncbi:MAG: AAA family ATPase [Acidobacteriota bacterium]|nr:AAA family ATPase [Acidobacteriota bacterium]
MEKLDGFVLEDTLYMGSRSCVYRGRREKDNLRVIVKAHTPTFPDINLINRFLREYEIGSKIESEYVVRYLECRKYGHGLALIEADNEAVALSHQIPPNGMPVHLFLKIGVQMARGLEAIHKGGIMHKDLKPGNLVFNTTTNKAWIIDFGLASTLQEEHQKPIGHGRIEGTLAYMSPEQTGRMNRPVDYRTDFYSLGVTFYEMLTGRLPFETDDQLALVHCQIARNPKPLNDHRPDLPKTICEIVARLMAKSPEERYQSAHGLHYDLSQCLEQLERKGQISRFKPGQRDAAERFRVSKTLFGREEELELLMQCFHRVTTGCKEMLLIAGYSGIGKSSLVHEVHKPIAARRGLFISGKFDQYQRNVPYAAVLQAFRELINDLMSEPEESLTKWRDRLNEALSPNAGVLVELVPELGALLGEVTAVQELEPGMAENRFNNVIRNFVKVFARKQNPLVLFLDDLQWADSATFQLLRVLADDKDSYLMVIGAFRDNEVDERHPMFPALKVLEQKGMGVHRLDLEPLKRRDLEKLIAETLRSSTAKVRKLTSLVMAKTGGNPYFVNQFLEMLQEKALISFDREEHCWTWDVAQIEAQNITDNVADLVLDKLRALPEQTSNTLGLAACLGNRFELSTLALAGEKEPLEVARALLPGIKAGLVAPSDHIFEWTRLVENADYLPPQGDKLEITLKFLHDRVLQCAYALIPEEERTRLHLDIGRRLLVGADIDESNSLLFLTCEQLNQGRELIDSTEESLALAKINLRVGKQARDSLAYQPAMQHYNLAMEMLTNNHWQNQYDLSCQIYSQAAGCLACMERWDEADAMFDTLLEYAQNNLDEATFCYERHNYHRTHYHWDEAFKWGARALELLGEALPEGEEALNAGMEEARADFEALQKTQPIETLIQDGADDPQVLLLLRTLDALAANSYLNGMMPLHYYTVFTALNLMCRFGFNQTSSMIASWVSLYYMTQKNFAEGKRFCQLNMRLLDLYPSSIYASDSTNNLFAPLALTGHVDNVIKRLEDYYPISLELGNTQAALHNLGNAAFWRLFAGKPLEEVLSSLDFFIHASETRGLMYPATYGQIYRKLVLGLINGGEITNLRTEDFEEKYQEMLPNAILESVFAGAKFIGLFWAGREKEALAHGETMYEKLNLLEGMLYGVDPSLTHCILLSRIYHRRSPQDKRKYLNHIRKTLEQLALFSELCPANFEHKYLLLKAEYARLKQDGAEQIHDYFDRAAASANHHGYLQYEALANELHGHYWLTLNREKYAGLHLREARYLYSRWGAQAKAAKLERDYPALDMAMPQSNIRTTETISETVNSLPSESEGLDLFAVMRTARVLSSEIHLDRLLTLMIRAMVENAGAEKGVLILVRNNKLMIEATAEAASNHAEVLQSIPLEGCGLVPEALVRYVIRSRGGQIIHDGTQPTRFSKDPYLIQNQPKSLLCTPLIYKDHQLGALYLENNLVRHAFTENRVDVLEILLAQAAVSLENADLIQSLNAEIEKKNRAHEEIRKLNEELEARVQERTRQLEAAQKELVENAHRAGMADIATSVLHNVGNVLNSVIISTQVIDQTLASSKIHSLTRANKAFTRMMNEDLMTKYPKLEQLREYYDLLNQMLQDEHKETKDNLDRIDDKIRIINNVITAQQGFVAHGTKDQVSSIYEIVEDAMGIYEGNLARNQITYNVFKDADPHVSLQKAKLIHVLINLFKNAAEAMQDTEPGERYLNVLITQDSANAYVRISDTGVGIEEELLEKVFNHGYTTKQEGHGFGLHSSANALTEMGGKLHAESEGKSKGATFVLTLPLPPQDEFS